MSSGVLPRRESLTFIHTTHNNKDLDTTHIRAIRSHVARISHSRLASEQAARRSRKWPVPLQIVSPSSSDSHQSAVQPSHVSPGQFVMTTNTPPSSRPQSAVSDVYLLRPVGVNPFRWSPLNHAHCLPLLIHHYLTQLAADIPELDSPGRAGSLRSHWFPMVVGDPSLFHIVMLISASHYAAQNQKSTSTVQLLQMKQHAITLINQSITSRSATGSPVTDQIVGSVAKMAAYEAMFGTPAAYHAHMKGLKQMIALRGGVDAIRGLDGLVARMVIWIDANAAHVLGTHLHFEQAMLPIRQVVLTPNPNQFLGHD